MSNPPDRSPLFDEPCCDEDCLRCNGEYCDIHITEPCECDVCERHSITLEESE